MMSREPRRIDEDHARDAGSPVVGHERAEGLDLAESCVMGLDVLEPAADTSSLRMIVSYPESGVLRTYCGMDTMAWLDWVVDPKKFRSST